MEEDREILMLDNIKESIENKLLEQHKEKLKIDKKIEKAGVQKKIEEISKVIADHIIKGNEVKLLNSHEVKDEEDSSNDPSIQLREDTAFVREQFKKIDSVSKQLLIDKYLMKIDEEVKD